MGNAKRGPLSALEVRIALHQHGEVATEGRIGARQLFDLLNGQGQRCRQPDGATQREEQAEEEFTAHELGQLSPSRDTYGTDGNHTVMRVCSLRDRKSVV